MKKYKFFIQITQEEVVEANSAEEARMKLVQQEKYPPDAYIDDGKEIKEQP